MKTTIVSIAREAGVSTATVDRVLNNRAGVRERTRNRVMTVAVRLGYLPEAPANGTKRSALTNLDFVLPGGTNTFLNVLADLIESQSEARRSDARINVHRIVGFDPDALAEKLAGLKGKTSGIGVVGLDHPTVREALRDVAASGVPVLTMVSDISAVPRIGYVGIDNRAAGRLAGFLLGRFMRPGKTQVALFAGSLSYRGHEEREMGFRHILAEEFSHLEIVELREVRDDIERSHREAKALLETYGGLAGIYNIGAGNRGIARALEETGRARDVIFVGHELTEYTRRFLVSGLMAAVIDQNPRVEARDAVDRLLHAARERPQPNLAPIRMQAIFRENIPEV